MQIRFVRIVAMGMILVAATKVVPLMCRYFLCAVAYLRCCMHQLAVTKEGLVCSPKYCTTCNPTLSSQ